MQSAAIVLGRIIVVANLHSFALYILGPHYVTLGCLGPMMCPTHHLKLKFKCAWADLRTV